VTDRQTEFSLLDRVCIACSAVKIKIKVARVTVEDTIKILNVTF